MSEKKRKPTSTGKGERAEEESASPFPDAADNVLPNADLMLSELEENLAEEQEDVASLDEIEEPTPDELEEIEEEKLDILHSSPPMRQRPSRHT